MSAGDTLEVRVGLPNFVDYTGSLAAFVVAVLSRHRARRAEVRQIVQEEIRKGVGR